MEFTVVVPVTFGNSEPGWSEGLWETVSLDIWLVVVVWKDWLGCVSCVLVGVCEEVESDGDDDDTSSKVGREVTSCVCRVFLLVVMVDKVMSVFFATVEGVGFAAFVVISCSAAEVEMVKQHKNTLWKAFTSDQNQAFGHSACSHTNVNNLCPEAEGHLTTEALL